MGQAGASGDDLQAGLALLQGPQAVVRVLHPVGVEQAAQGSGSGLGPRPVPPPPPATPPAPQLQHLHQLLQRAAGLLQALRQLQDARVAHAVVAEVQLAQAVVGQQERGQAAAAAVGHLAVPQAGQRAERKSGRRPRPLAATGGPSDLGLRRHPNMEGEGTHTPHAHGARGFLGGPERATKALHTVTAAVTDWGRRRVLDLGPSLRWQSWAPRGLWEGPRCMTREDSRKAAGRRLSPWKASPVPLASSPVRARGRRGQAGKGGGHRGRGEGRVAVTGGAQCTKASRVQGTAVGTSLQGWGFPQPASTYAPPRMTRCPRKPPVRNRDQDTGHKV